MSSEDNSLHISWHDSAWIPHLKQDNILDYFANRSNPFYDRTCNNEIIKMQRVSPEQLKSMTGLEYVLLHVQEPILYIIRKQHRHTLEDTTPLADYYIIDGRVYQAPDLCAVINARMATAVHNIRSAFEESLSYSNYHPSKGYWWEFKDKDNEAEKTKKKKPKEELSSIFQRKRVDVLLGDLSRKFPFKVIQPKPGEKPIPVDGSGTTPDSNVVRPVAKEEIKEENNQSQNNANTAVPGPSVPSIASGVSGLSGGGATAASVGGSSVVSNSAGVVAGGSGGGGGGGGGGTFFASSGGPSSVKPSVAKKRKIMGK